MADQDNTITIELTSEQQDRLDMVRRYFKRETAADTLRLLIALAYPSCATAVTEESIERAASTGGH